MDFHWHLIFNPIWSASLNLARLNYGSDLIAAFDWIWSNVLYKNVILKKNICVKEYLERNMAQRKLFGRTFFYSSSFKSSHRYFKLYIIFKLISLLSSPYLQISSKACHHYLFILIFLSSDLVENLSSLSWLLQLFSLRGPRLLPWPPWWTPPTRRRRTRRRGQEERLGGESFFFSSELFGSRISSNF